MRFILLLLLTVSSLAFGQRSQTIDADCLRIKDGTCIDKLELGYLDGASSAIQVQIDSKANASDVSTSLSGKVGTTGDESVAGVKTFTGKITASSTTNGFKPCPEMTEAQRDAVVSPALGECVTNSNTLSLNIYNGSTWKAAGGGLSDWVTAFGYAIGDIVVESSKIYQCLVAHTSGTFATDLASLNWGEVSAGLTGIISLANGGTAKNITASNGAIAYSDTDSLELLAPGTSGQILKTNGVAAPSWIDFSAANLSGTVAVSGGGTGLTTMTLNNVILGNGTSSLQFVAPGTAGNMLVSDGTTWSSSAVSGTTLTTSTGATSPDIQSVYFASGADCSSGTCTSNNLIGNKITSVSYNSTGQYFVNGIDGTKYNCVGNGRAAGGMNVFEHIRASSTSSYALIQFWVNGGGTNVRNASVVCLGKP